MPRLLIASDYEKALERRESSQRPSDRAGCPSCGGFVTYRGLTNLECNGDMKCPNFKLAAPLQFFPLNPFNLTRASDGTRAWAKHWHDRGHEMGWRWRHALTRNPRLVQSDPYLASFNSYTDSDIEWDFA